jgi:hypothetical protein
MTSILEDVYNRLAFEKFEFGFTKAEFSKQYLGKCETYFSYIKSTGNDVSADALLKLFGKLNKEYRCSVIAANNTEHEFQKHMLTEWAALYRELSSDVLDAICDRTHVLRPLTRDVL